MLSGAGGGLSISFELSDATDACLGGDAANTSQDWQIEQMTCHVDSVTLTSELTSAFAAQLERGESILIPYQANSSDVQYVQNGGQYTISMAKQFSRLATVFCSLGVADADTTVMTKSMNNFFLAQNSGNVGAQEVESWFTVNNKRFPQFNTQGTKQHLHRLIQATGTWNSTSHAVNIGSVAYGDGSAAANMWMQATDLEAIPHSQASGMLVQGGGQIQIHLKNVGDASRVYIHCHFDACLEITSQGAISYS
tara:strand:+ start:50 stop:805 length:756 start_codon:yes stop_codon:yes gene_type:complete